MNSAKTSVSSKQNQRLLAAAQKAMKHAYAPYSQFKVGAALLTSKGKVFSGCNVENASYGLSNCAERTAIFTAIAESGPRLDIRAIAVVNDQGVPCSPCGACRQTIHEFSAPDTIIFFPGENNTLAQTTMAELLPAAFNLKT